jgi:hypothetical protein
MAELYYVKWQKSTQGEPIWESNRARCARRETLR